MNRPWIGPRYASLFSWGRPPLPWDLADLIHAELAAHQVSSVGVTGSICPSVLTALGYAAPGREINIFANHSRWDDCIGWNNVVEDSPGMEKSHPWSDPYLPVKAHFWDGATPFFRSEALFVDLPFSHHCVRLKMKFLDEHQYKVILLGFLEGHDGPEDLLRWATEQGYTICEHRGEKLFYREQRIELEYRLAIATPSSVAD